MAVPVTTTEVLLQQVVGLLTEIRGLLQPAPEPAATEATPPAAKATKKTAAKAARKPPKE